MLLLFDIGNTAATYGIVKKGRLASFGSCLYSDIPKIIHKNSKNGRFYSKNIVISAVVPKISSIVGVYGKAYGFKIWTVGKNLPIPVKHHYPKNKTPGIDRILNIYGVLQLYKAPALVVDFGTAMTFDYVSRPGTFEGGMIIPGPELSFQSLIQRAALLPKKARLPQKAKFFIGTNTLDCLKSGILQGYGAMTEGLIQRFKSRYGKDLKVIATGGFSLHIKPYAKGIDIVDPQLSIKSLLLLFQQHPH